MTKYSIGPLHFSFSCSFEWRTKRHDRIFRVVDAYCRQNVNTDKLGIVVPIDELQLFSHCNNREPCLHSAKELASVISELQRRGYGPCLHDDLITPSELWEFFQWVRTEGAPHIQRVNGEDVVVQEHTINYPEYLYVEVYRWRNPGRLER